MSLWRACSDAFFYMGKLIRDLDSRVKELEKRTTILYPDVRQPSSYKNIKDTYIYRGDGTKAMELIHQVGVTPNNLAGDINMTYGQTTVRIYGPDGITVIHSYVLKPSGSAFGLIENLKP